MATISTDAETRALRARWLLDPGVRFLNHGSYGACPREVLAEQTALRERMERQPVQFFRDLEGLLDGARRSLAALLGADADDLGLVPNATTGVGCVLRSLEFSPGDELLTTDHAYNSCKNSLLLATRQGARLVVAAVPFPLEDPQQVIDAIRAALTPRTKLALIDHVTSATGLVFPIAAIVSLLQARGIDVLVDGAHAPGMIPLALDSLGAAYYAGNCHKWLCAPKGSGFLHVRRDRQRPTAPGAAARDSALPPGLRELPAILPWTISHGLNSARSDRSRFRLLWDQLGTLDATPWLCLPRALQFLSGLFPGGLVELHGRNRTLALEGQRMLCEALGIARPAPAEMLGALASVPLPDRPAEQRPHPAGASQDPLSLHLLERHQIEAPVFAWPDSKKRLLRISAQAYVQPAELAALAGALKTELAAEGVRL